MEKSGQFPCKMHDETTQGKTFLGYVVVNA